MRPTCKEWSPPRRLIDTWFLHLTDVGSDMPLGIEDAGVEPFSLDDEQRDLEIWKQVCRDAIVNFTPRLARAFSLQARTDWDQFLTSGAFHRLQGPMSSAARFPDSALSILFVWSVEWRLFQESPSSDRDKIVQEFLESARMNARGFVQSWRILQPGKSALILAACSEAIGEKRLQLVFQAFHWACEAEFLRRIRQATSAKNRNDVPTIVELAILRFIHCSAKGLTLTDALNALRKSSLHESERYRSEVTDLDVGRTIEKWGEPYRIRCEWSREVS